MCGNFMMVVNTKSKKGRTYICSDLSCRYEEAEEKGNPTDFRRSRKDDRMNRQLINRFSDNTKRPQGVVSLGDLFEAALDKNKK
jgi:hypothetical protein